MNSIILAIIGIIIAYLLGSISTGIVVTKIARLPDPREGGSNNPGATNVLRTSGTKYAVLTLIGDALKGFIAVIIGLLLLDYRGIGLGLIAFAAVIGHMYPLYFKFEGGKGVATTLGALFPLSPALGIIIVIVWLVIAVISRYASLASLISAIAAPFLCLAIGHPAYFIGLTLIAIMIIYQHRGNIRRLTQGEERRLFEKNTSDADDEQN